VRAEQINLGELELSVIRGIRRVMFRTMFAGKIHRATVTHADLHYVGSLTVDRDLLDAANILPGEKVSVVDVTNGSRLDTYVIEGERGSGVMGINGAAAHLVAPGDLVIVISYAIVDDAEASTFRPNVVHVDAQNHIFAVGDDPAAAMTDDVLTPPHAAVATNHLGRA